MSNHFLKRNPDNEPVCCCGFRPEILDGPAPVGKLWKAKAAVLDHVKALNGFLTDCEAAVHSSAEYIAYAQPATPRSPEAPFRSVNDVRYPRAGVRQTEDGRWLLTFWDGDEIVHVIDKDDRTHSDRYTAFTHGWLTVGDCRQSGTNLNGWAKV